MKSQLSMLIAHVVAFSDFLQESEKRNNRPIYRTFICVQPNQAKRGKDILNVSFLYISCNCYNKKNTAVKQFKQIFRIITVEVVVSRK